MELTADIHFRDRLNNDELEIFKLFINFLESKRAGKDVDLGFCLGVLADQLGKDKANGSLFYTWQSSIAMSMYDEFVNFSLLNTEIEATTITVTPTLIHNICNNAAANFIELLISKSITN